MPGIDYSKWDKLAVSDDDDEEGDESCLRSKPAVTTLTAPARVTIGPTGVQLAPEASATPFAAAPATRPALDKALCASSETQQAGRRNTNEEADEDTVLFAHLTRNGGREGNSHLWSQTADTVTVSFIVPRETKSKDVRCFRVYTLQETPVRRDAISFALTCRNDTADAGQTVISHTLRYPVKLAQDLLDGCWQLRTLERQGLRLLVVQLAKEALGAKLTLWWDRCFVDDVEALVATECIADRAEGKQGTGGEALQKVWDEAHAEFRRRMQERRRQAQDRA